MAGTAPGLQSPTKPAPKTVNLKCRNQGCGGVTAIEVIGSQEGNAPSNRVYQCTECQGTWGVSAGGFFPY